MRYLLIVLLIAVPTGIAGAHTVTAEQGLLTALGHQVAALHHLPFTLLIIAAAVLVLARSKWGQS